MPERKHSFLKEVFPKIIMKIVYSQSCCRKALTTFKNDVNNVVQHSIAKGIKYIKGILDDLLNLYNFFIIILVINEKCLTSM